MNVTGVLIFFFKQKTAYEIKECDWSSDVCSSDLMKIFSDEREARLKEFSTVEVSFGILILLGATVLNTKLLDVLVLDYKSILISITFFTFYFSFVSLLISIIRIVTHKSLIDKFFTEKY